MYQNANEIKFLEKVAIIGFLFCIGWFVWNHFNAPEVLIEKEFSVLSRDEMGKKSWDELLKLNGQLKEYKQILKSRFWSRDLSDEEYDFIQTNQRLVNDAFVYKIGTQSLTAEELVSFVSNRLCNLDMMCFQNDFGVWSQLTEVQQKTIVQAIQYYFEHAENIQTKAMLALLLGEAYYTGGGLMTKDYFLAINHFAVAWKLKADTAAYWLYLTYSRFDRQNNRGNMYLWGLRSKTLVDLDKLEQELTSEQIKQIQALARDPLVLNVDNSQ